MCDANRFQQCTAAYLEDFLRASFKLILTETVEFDGRTVFTGDVLDDYSQPGVGQRLFTITHLHVYPMINGTFYYATVTHRTSVRCCSHANIAVYANIIEFWMIMFVYTYR